MGTYHGNFDFQTFKIIYIHCDQISTCGNVYNGKPSAILNILPVPDKIVGSLDRIRQFIAKKVRDFNI